MSFGRKMKQLRTNAGLSQQEVAEKLGLARATYASLEVDRRDPHLAELRALAQFYEVPLVRLVTPEENVESVVNEPSTEYKVQQKSEASPQNHGSQFNPEKLRQVLLYVAEKVGAKPNVGESAICKLLYFIDTGYQEKFGHSVTGLTYVHSDYGPTPTRSFTDVVGQMEASNELEIVSTKHFNNTQKKYLPLRKADLQGLSANELDHVNTTLARLADMTTAELTELYAKTNKFTG